MEWIKFKEKKPKNFATVLAINTCGDIFITTYYSVHEKFSSASFPEEEDFDLFIVGWMLLPHVPEWVEN